MPDTLDELIGQLADYRTRHAARMRLKEMGPAIADRLLPLMEDPTRPENLRWSVLALLVAWNQTSAAPALLRLARNDRTLHSEAVRALQTLTGFEIGENLDEWEKALADPEGYAARQEAEADEPAAVVEQPQVEVGKPPEEIGRELFQRALAETASEFKWEDEGYLYMRFELQGSRKQQIVVTFHEANADGQTLATIYTECGPASPEAMTIIHRRNLTVKHGKFEFDGPEGEQKVVMRERIPLAHLDEKTIRDKVLSIAVEADSLEHELTKEDRI